MLMKDNWRRAFKEWPGMIVLKIIKVPCLLVSKCAAEAFQ